jgi:hypothetical protein
MPGVVHGDQGGDAKMTLEIAGWGSRIWWRELKIWLPAAEACITSRSAPTPPYGQKPGTHRVAAGSMGRLDDIDGVCADAAIWPEAGHSSGSRRSMGRLDDIDGVIGRHQRAGRFNEFHCAVVSLATTIARTVGM